jgi:hypothetical protein
MAKSSNKQIIKTATLNKTAVLLILTFIVGFVFGLFIHQKKFTFKLKKSSYLSNGYKDWSTYTTNSSLDIPKVFLERKPIQNIPTMSIKVSDNWTIPSGDNSALSYNDTTHINFSLYKDPEPAKCVSDDIEGRCFNNSASIQFTVGVVPEGLPYFDSNFWGNGFVSMNDEEVNINGTKAIKSYYEYEGGMDYPKSTIFVLSPTLQLKVDSEIYLQDADEEKREVFRRETVDEINAIINSIQFE